VGRACEAFFCTAQARVVAHGFIWHLLAETFWLDLAPGLAEKLVRHLGRYLISEQVELADRTAEHAQLHLAGPKAKETLDRATNGQAPDLGELQCATLALGEGSPLQIRRNGLLGLSGYDLVCPGTAAGLLREALARAGAQPAGTEAYHTLRVEAGTPFYGPDIDDSRFAFEAGRTRQAICYTKGCYLGQEPIVMARDRGQANRTLTGVRIAGEGPVPHGAKLFRDGSEVGMVTSSVLSPLAGAVVGLAYVRRGHHEPGTKLEVEAGGGRLPAEVSSLPFSGGGTRNSISSM
ncbi:MAG TPA: glycine cleavage T C-terminal barrel domain-containing protein, partial [Gemmataceae bacterium]|nr:glycine cleavage T C-terminal barrel domain-containing protein [Gemmataceae bacterium]